eukprot:Skav235237  [mRNA]  locus=scaffold3995:261306:264101:+ [translate_table: standard]
MIAFPSWKDLATRPKKRKRAKEARRFEDRKLGVGGSDAKQAWQFYTLHESAVAASDLIEKMRKGGAGDQRLLAAAAERIAAEPDKELDLFDIFFHLHSLHLRIADLEQY